MSHRIIFFCDVCLTEYSRGSKEHESLLSIQLPWQPKNVIEVCVKCYQGEQNFFKVYANREGHNK